MALGAKVQHYRKKAGLTLDQLSIASGVDVGTISALENRNSTRSKYGSRLAAALGMSVEMLESDGDHDVVVLMAAAKAGQPVRPASNVEPGPDLKGLVPLISWVQAGDWHGAEDPLHPGEAEMWMPSPVKCSPSSYALRVRGDSMTAAHGNTRSYPEGSIIFVDPERCMPVNGDRIIAKLVDADEVSFKVYKNEDGRQWLHPLNPTHEPIRQPFKVLGTVVGTWIPE